MGLFLIIILAVGMLAMALLKLEPKSVSLSPSHKRYSKDQLKRMLKVVGKSK